MENEIAGIMVALQNNQLQVVNQYLKEKWEQDVTLFIESVVLMRSTNAQLADRHFNSSEFLQQFTAH